MELTVAEIAARLGAEAEGDAAVVVRGVAGVRDAAPGDIAFVAQARYAPDAARTCASALLVGKDWSKPSPAALIRVEQPEEAFARVASWYAPPPVAVEPGIHPTAVVAAGARIGAGSSIGAHAVIEPGAVLGDRCVIGALCYVGHGARIGSDVRLYPHVSIREHCILGDRVILHNGTVIGSDGFGYTVDKSGVRHKIPQIGIVVIGNDVELGANVTVDRARFGRTRIGNGVKVDNLVQIAHNVVIGDHAVIVAQVAIAGSCIIGEKAVIAGQAGIAGHLVVGAGAVVGGGAGVTKDVPPGVFVSGYPAAPHAKAAELHAHLSRLPQLKARVAELEKELKALRDKTG
jgi:UDP-3-O-[3-hydroxymyristoyl] glucosamine N-acyltransferase